MSATSINILDDIHIVEGLAPAVPSSSTPDYISTKNALAVGVLIHVKNATTVTGSAITLKQATAVAGTSEKALSFTDYWKKEDTGAADAPWTRVTAVSDTFTPDATNSKNSMYFIPVDPAALDVNNSFDCVRAGTGNATAQTVSVYYLIKSAYRGNPSLVPSFIID